MYINDLLVDVPSSKKCAGTTHRGFPRRLLVSRRCLRLLEAKMGGMGSWDFNGIFHGVVENHQVKRRFYTMGHIHPFSIAMLA